MPGNWDRHQHLNNGRVEWPTGPYNNIGPNFAPSWVDAWVVQTPGGGGAPIPAGVVLPGPSQSAHGSAGSAPPAFTPNRWTANKQGWSNGTLQYGPATGIALMAMHNAAAGTYEFDWWFKVVVLR